MARHGGHGKCLQRQCEDNVKTATGVKNWVAFCKILVESIFVMLEEDPQDWFNGATKRAPKKGEKKKNPFLNSDSEEDFVPFTQKDPPIGQHLLTSTPVQSTSKASRKANVVENFKKPERVRGGADFDLQMGTALSISAEEVRKQIL